MAGELGALGWAVKEPEYSRRRAPLAMFAHTGGARHRHACKRIQPFASPSFSGVLARVCMAYARRAGLATARRLLVLSLVMAPNR